MLSTEQINALNKLSLELKENRKELEALPEEQTKQSLILPFLEILGYNPRKLGEIYWEARSSNGRLDCRVTDKNTEMLIECKGLKVKLTKTVIDQLDGYFNSNRADNKIGVATNGDTYIFFTNKVEQHMDKTPFYTFRLSDIQESDYANLYQFTKGQLCKYSVNCDRAYNKFKAQCIEEFKYIKAGTVSSKMVEYIAHRAGVEYAVDYQDEKLYSIVLDCLNETFGSLNEPNQCNSIQDNLCVKPANLDDILLHTEYTFTDIKFEYYTNCNFEYFKFYDEIKHCSTSKLLTDIVYYYISNSSNYREMLLNEFNGDKKTTQIVRGKIESIKKSEYCYFDDYDISVTTKLSKIGIFRFIQRIFDTLDIPYESLKICIDSVDDKKSSKNK